MAKRRSTLISNETADHAQGRAVAYIRVSTEKQPLSLEAQAERMRALAASRGEVVEIISDEASAKDMQRPGLQRIIAMVHEHEISTVIVWKLDRLTRSVRDLREMVELFNAYDVALVSLSESIDTKSAGGRMVTALLTVVSEWEREAIADRTRVALQHKKASGRVYNHVPYGFDRVDYAMVDGKPKGGRLAANDAEMTIATRIVAERRAGATLQAIADRLNSEGIPAKRGGQWFPASIGFVIGNREMYGVG
jgi:site-specific DNA recombinase